MKALFVFLLSAVIALSGFARNEKDGVRSAFHQAIGTEDGIEAFISSTAGQADPLSLAYQGLAEAMMAQYALLPTSKYSFFVRGTDKIERAIEKAPNDPELRYIRLMVQLNAPFFLGYQSDISEDLEALLNGFENDLIEQQWKRIFAQNLSSSDKLSSEKRSEMERWIREH